MYQAKAQEDIKRHKQAKLEDVKFSCDYQATQQVHLNRHKQPNTKIKDVK